MDGAFHAESSQRRRFKAIARWSQKSLDWALIEAVEDHLRRTVTLDGRKQVVDLVVSDQHSELDVADLKTARARIEQEASGLESVVFKIHSGSAETGRAATFQLQFGYDIDARREGWCGSVEWNYPNEGDVRAAKAEFNQWIQSKIQQCERAATVSTSPSNRHWWLPSFRHIRDHLVSNVVWLLGLVGSGGIAAFFHHHF